MRRDIHNRNTSCGIWSTGSLNPPHIKHSLCPTPTVPCNGAVAAIRATLAVSEGKHHHSIHASVEPLSRPNIRMGHSPLHVAITSTSTPQKPLVFANSISTHTVRNYLVPHNIWPKYYGGNTRNIQSPSEKLPPPPPGILH